MKSAAPGEKFIVGITEDIPLRPTVRIGVFARVKFI